MFSNLKRMVEKNNIASIIFILGNEDATLRKTYDTYKIVFEGEEGFEEHEVSENNFFKYLENGMKKIAFSGEYKISNTVKTETVCSFLIKRI